MSLLAGEPVPVDVAAIERASRDLWTAPEDPAVPLVRAQAATLVVYTTAAERANRAVAAVMQRFPGRTILIEAHRGAETPGLDAWIAARCHPGPGGHVCGEQITLAAAGEPPATLPALVAALRPADVPAYLWWDAPLPARPQLLRRLADGMERVIVDSARVGERASGRVDEWKNGRVEERRKRSGASPPPLAHSSTPLLAVFPRTLALARSRSLPPVADLAWTRVTPWRELIAQCFDPPEMGPLLARIERVTSRCAGRAGIVEAHLLAGWLAARLGWKAARGKGQRAGGKGQRAKSKGPGGAGGLPSSLSFTRPDGGPVVLSVEQADAGEEGLAGVRLEAGETAFVVERYADAPCVCVTVRAANGEERSRAVAMPPRSEGALLCQELAQAGEDPVMEAALAAACQAAGGMVT